MAEAIEANFKAEVELIPGSGGVLDVVADGKLIFSKFEKFYKPSPEEIVELMKKA
ncbi:Rdx family protein [bacterium]|nr:Rdx family protein [bacterium]